MSDERLTVPKPAKRYYTTGELAKLLGVSQQTAIRCIDSGELRGERLPGSSFRRVSHEALERFLSEEPRSRESLHDRVLLAPNDAPYLACLLADVLCDFIGPRTAELHITANRRITPIRISRFDLERLFAKALADRNITFVSQPTEPKSEELPQ